jgi:hypothetical protein
MPLAVLDWTANHVRAWNTLSDGVPPRPVRLDGDRAELPLVLLLERRHVRLGRSGLALCRQTPQQICNGFLSFLGAKKTWRFGRHAVTPEQAIATVATHLREKLTGTKKVLLTVPEYLDETQQAKLRDAMQEAGMKVLGLLRRSLSIGTASHWDHPWLNVGVLVDVDEHALSCTVLRPDPVDLHLERHRILPNLGLRWWRERLMAAVADLCIRQHRRDPRAVAEADQMLFDQSDAMLDAVSQGQGITVNVQVGHWVQQLTLTTAMAASTCGILSRPAAQTALAALTETVRPANGGGTLYLTPEAARLPGLAAACYELSQSQVPVVLLRSAAEEAALEFAQRIDQGKLRPFDSHTVAVPLAPPGTMEAPATLRFPGQARISLG